MTQLHSSHSLRGAKRLALCLTLAAPVGALWACSSDDPAASGPNQPPSPEAGEPGLNRPDAAVAPLTCGDAGGAGPRVFIVQCTAKESELAVIDVSSKTVEGRFTFDGVDGTPSVSGPDPFVTGGQSDIVTRLDVREPWKEVAHWDVHGTDAIDGGLPNANPISVVQPACNKAYVLRYNRDQIAIIDPTDTVSGAPKGYIDLAPLKQAGDPDSVEPTAAVYVPAKKRVYVLLGNGDLTRFVKTDVTTLLVCADLKPSIIAIDVETDKLVDLGGTAPGGGIALEGYNPVQIRSLAYDATLDRLLVLQAGCNAALEDGGAGDMMRRRVEQVDLATGKVSTVLSLDDRGFPSSLALASSDQAALAFYYDGYHWDTKSASLGEQIPGTIDLVVPDHRGAFVGSYMNYGDGGVTVLAAPVTDAGPTVIVENPFPKAGNYVFGIEAWSR